MSFANQAFPIFLSNVLEFTFGEVLNYSEKMGFHNDSKHLPIQWCLFYAALRQTKLGNLDTPGSYKIRHQVVTKKNLIVEFQN